MHNLTKGLSRAASGAGALALVAGLAATAGAQQQSASSSPWRAWFGCWSAGAVTPLGVDSSMPLVCVTPGASANAARIATIADGKVVSTQTVDASGREMPLDEKGCTGTQSGRWSADGRRVYLNAVATCDGALRTTSGILGMTPGGEWLDVQGVKAGSEEKVRVARYRDVGLRNSVPAEIAETLRNTDLSVNGARVAAGADIGTTAVIEASKVASAGVTEAFILERGQQFRLGAQELVALADAGISPRITDAMVAVSNPQKFAVNPPAAPVQDALGDDEVTGRRVYVVMDRFASPWGWGYDPYGFSGYSPYGYNGYGAGYNGRGYYGSGYYPGVAYGSPVVIVRGSDTAQPHGRLVKGRGYEQGTARPRDTGSSNTRGATYTPSTRGSSSSSGSTGSSGSSSSGSSERTAKPRP